MVEIIAELAQGFEGDVEKASLLLKLAASSNADCAKFQVIFADDICTPSYEHYKLFKSLEMPQENWARLVEESAEQNIKIILDVFGPQSLAVAKELKVQSIMLHATDVNNFQLIDFVSKSDFKEVYVGVGGASIGEIKSCVTRIAAPRLVLMMGFQAYPTEIHDLQLQKIRSLCEEFSENYKHLEVGFGDHSLPNSNIFEHIFGCAIAFGATVIEKHLTLSPLLKMEDYESAVGGQKFKDFVANIRTLVKAFDLKSTSFDKLSDGERKYKEFVSRQFVAIRELEAGETVGPDDITLKRTGKKSQLSNPSDIIGRTLRKRLVVDQVITTEELL